MDRGEGRRRVAVGARRPVLLFNAHRDYVLAWARAVVDEVCGVSSVDCLRELGHAIWREHDCGRPVLLPPLTFLPIASPAPSSLCSSSSLSASSPSSAVAVPSSPFPSLKHSPSRCLVTARGRRLAFRPLNVIFADSSFFFAASCSTATTAVA
eukprot:4636141-Pleurochrysis_carterae.AAC.1